METSEFAAAIRKTTDSSLAGGSPVVLDAPEGTVLKELLAEVGRWAGAPRNLAMGGFTDPSLTERTGLPLVEPFGDELQEMRGWPCESHWIGCGTVGTPHGERVVAVIAHREEPAVTGFPEGSSWAERLCVLTGWEPVPRPAVDWRAAEAELGTPLPRDYKEIVDLFGTGTFDDYVDLLVPGARGMDIVVWAGLGGDGTDLYEPYAAYPAPGGLLRWGSSEQELDFVWQTGAADPDDWPVLCGEYGDWRRFDCGLGEFLVRMLTDVRYGFPTSHQRTHYFESYDL
ncbi:hypothetical protein GCM10010503_44300 [Streptomyces lucensis JCM 4490]|uniref:Knr4/Smi1-like domain-containing protein n=1 Tax=Streptomyces lucensis JCM 4490 TaxID=1306176 RepID=A0A918MSP3_9ACTN|nr:hypothetical protein [Streptomyces lucensis]GGW62193.1 hypothetical protein GCM10010503_44300 [Streptomyces lucensis JCM 4490]